MIRTTTLLRRRACGVASVALLGVALSGCGSDPETDAQAAPAASTPAPAAQAAQQRPFAKDSVWNQRADGLAVDPGSTTLLKLASQRVGVVDRRGDETPVIEHRTVDRGLNVNTRRWAVPVVSGGVATKVSCRQRGCGEKIASLRIPTDVDPDPRYDGWFTVIDGDKAYDLWRARRESDDSISYQYVRVWDLNGSGIGKVGERSARGSGLPLFAGLIRRQELDAGIVGHALAISVPGPAQRRFVRPASGTNGNGVTASLPEGARIRLKPGIRLTGSTASGRSATRRQQRARDAILVALRQYGAIVVDRAAVPSLYAEQGIAADTLVGDELAGLTLDDFEVTKLGPVLFDPPASKTDPTTEGSTP